MSSCRATNANAAVSLLCEALARVPCEGPESIGVRHEDGCPLDIDEAVKVASPADCIALGHALIAAGVAAKGGE